MRVLTALAAAGCLLFGAVLCLIGAVAVALWMLLSSGAVSVEGL